MGDNEQLMVSIAKAWLERVLIDHGDLPMYSSVDGYGMALDVSELEVKEEDIATSCLYDDLPKRVWIGEPGHR